MRTSCKQLAAIFLAICFVLTTGCSRDIDAQKQKFFESGIRYFQQSKYAEASIQFQNAIQKDGKFAAAHLQLAKCYIERNLWPLAFRELSITIQIEPRNLDAELELANLLFEAKQFQSSRERAAIILQQYPDDVSAQLILSTADGELGRLDEAIEEARQAVQTAPGKPETHLTLGLLEEKAGRLPAAEKDLQKAVANDPKFLAGRLGLGRFYQAQERWKESELQYQAAIEAEPRRLLPRTSLAALYGAWGKRDLAERTLQETKAVLQDDPAAYILLGDFYLANGSLEKASEEFWSLHQQHPDDTTVTKRYIQILLEMSKWDLAAQLSEEVLKRNSQDSEALLDKGRALLMEERAVDAVAPLEAAAKIDPDNPAGHFQLGVAYFRTGNTARAGAEWQEAIKLQPSMVAGHENLAKLAAHTGDMKLLESSTTEWIKYAPSSPLAYLLHGVARMRGGDASGAEKDFRRSMELAPENAGAYTRLGDLRLTQKRFVDAQKLYEQALTLNAPEMDALQGLVTVFLAQGQPERAVNRVQVQMTKVSDSADLEYLLAESLIADHKAGEAERALKRSIGLDKTGIRASLLLAQLQSGAGDLDSAVSTLEETIRKDPRDVRAYVDLGAYEERRGNWQRAEDLYKKALQIQPKQPSAANNLSFLLLEHGGDMGYALSLAQTARGAMPDSPNAADTLGWAYVKSGVYATAIPLFQEAIKKMPTNPTYHYHLGLAYQKSQKTELARASFQRAIKLEPQSARADEIRKTLTELDKSE